MRLIKFVCIFLFIGIFEQPALQAQTNLISLSDGGFETGTTFAANGWTEVNGSPIQANKWFCGSTGTSGFIGTRCAYIGTAANNNNYSNVTSASHIYRDIVIPPGLSDITLSFRWKVRGRSNEDYMMLYIADPTVAPTAGVIYPNGQVGTEYRNQTTWAVESITLPCEYAGTTKRLVFSWVNDDGNNNNPAIALDNISLVASSPGTCESLLGLGVFQVPSLPFNSGAGTTCHMDDDIGANDVTACGDPLYYSDRDVVWVFTPQTSGQISIDLNAPVALGTGLMLYDGCPIITCDASPTICVAQAQDPGGNKSLCVSVIANHTYYLILDGNLQCNNYDNLYISSPNSFLVGNTCSNPVDIISLPLNLPNESTSCMGNEYDNSTPGSCGSFFESGEDKVYRYVASGPECLSIVLNNMSTNLMGYSIFSGCPGAGGICIGGFGGGYPLITNFTLPSAGIYYIVVDSWAPPMSVSYDLFISSYGNSLVSNDEPCMAQEIISGQITFGDNNCSTGNNEPDVPGCWISGGISNTVWFKYVIPPSGNVFISTQIITIQNTQIAAYLGNCYGLAEIDCNDDGAFLNPASNLNLTGLPPGDTLFISVDGYGDFVGTFNLLITEGIIGSAYNQQDCLGAINVCSSVMSSNESYFGPGLVDEIPAPGTISNPDINPAGYNSGCLLSGERNTVWYAINVTTPGVLQWKLTHQPGCYDWIMYDLTNNSCSDILNNTLAPIRCNWNGGCLTTAGMLDVIPIGSSSFDFQAPLNVVAGQHLVLALSNWSGTSGSYSLDFSNSTCSFGGSNVLNWSGENGTDWTFNNNWGGCTTPGCGISSSIFPSANQPIISSNAVVQDITILPGASLTLGPNSVLQVCGNFTNLGNLIADPSSVIVMSTDSTIQHFDGILTGNNKLGHVYIPKLGGSVILNKSIELQGDLSIVDAGSAFELNGQTFTTSGSIYNSNGAATFKSSLPGSILEFNGNAEQYFATNGDVELTNLWINKPSGIAEFYEGNLILDSLGTLNLSSGILFTGDYELHLKNKNPNSIIGGHDLSYIVGHLRRDLSGIPDVYEFPIGDFEHGYQRAIIEFTTPTTIPNLLSNFNTYSTIPNGPTGIDCSGYTYGAVSVLDNGYWNIHASENGDSGIYNVTLFNQGFTASGTYATVVKSTIDPPTANSWELVGECDLASNQFITRRVGLSGFSSFGVGIADETPLPVSLVSFSGFEFGTYNHLDWTTASETNSDYFIVESSFDGINYNQLTQVEAAGYSNSTLQYEYIDLTPEIITYYRLKQVDLNGDFIYCDPIVITRIGYPTTFNVMPNPAQSYSQLNFRFAENSEATLALYNSAGELIEIFFRGETGSDNHQINYSCSHLPKGVYFFRLISNNHIENLKFIVI